MKHFITKKKTLTVLSIILMLVLWKVLAVVFDSPLTIPHPEATFLAVVKLFAEPGFLMVAGSTVVRVDGIYFIGIAGYMYRYSGRNKPGVQHLYYSHAGYHQVCSCNFSYPAGSYMVSHRSCAYLHRLSYHVPVHLHQRV